MSTVMQHPPVASRLADVRLPIVAPGSRLHRWLLWCGPVGSLLFTGVYLLDGFAHPGFDATRDTISALSLGPFGWIQIANFLVFGLLTALYGIALRATLAPGAGSTAIPALKVMQAVGLLLAGWFVMDPTGTSPATLHGTIHLTASVLTLTFTWLGWFIFAFRLANEPRWRAWSAFAVATGLLVLVSLAGMGLAIGSNGAAGLFERLASIASAPLTIALVVRLTSSNARLSSGVEEQS